MDTCPRCEHHPGLVPHQPEHKPCADSCGWLTCPDCRLTVDPDRRLAIDKAGPVHL